MQKLLDQFNTLSKKSQRRVAEILEEQPKMVVTAHLDKEGQIDCVCSGSLCVASGVVSEEALTCRRMEWIFSQDVTNESEEERQLRSDHPASLFKAYVEV